MKRARRCLALLWAIAALGGCARPEVVVGSKSFTESVVLGEIARLLAESDGESVAHVQELGGTQILWSALLQGEIDAYPEYTGTIRQEIFAGRPLADDESLRRALAEQGVLMTRPLGFNNTYALGIKEQVARRLDVRTYSDLKNHPALRFGFSNEFMNRGDGWPSLRDRYGFTHSEVTGMEHALAYRALQAGDLDVTDVYSTDPSIKKYGLRLLEDDLQHFPRYDAVFLYRDDLPARSPALARVLQRLEGRLDNAAMLALNEQVEAQKISEARAAAGFLAEQFNVSADVRDAGFLERIWFATLEHLLLVVVSLSMAIAVAVPLGIVAAKKPVAGHFILSSAEIVQTIPGLALLIFLSVGFGPLGLSTIGAPPVIVALFCYSLLPIIRNTSTGLTDVPASLKESAKALGLSPLARLRLVELPMASRLILAGIKTTAVINVGYAALGGLIGAGGYGQTIMTGLRLNDQRIMMEGAIPAAMLALLVKWAFEYCEQFLVPAGLRLQGK